MHADMSMCDCHCYCIHLTSSHIMIIVGILYSMLPTAYSSYVIIIVYIFLHILMGVP
jgi:hypothetical protein